MTPLRGMTSALRALDDKRALFVIRHQAKRGHSSCR
jgi:hypothetical protein